MASLATRPAAPGDPSADAANPYAGNKHLTEDQQTLLAEYARLAVTIQSIATRATALSATNTHSALLSELRILERKMGLVLTLFKASVWSVVTADADAMAEDGMEHADADADGGAYPDHQEDQYYESAGGYPPYDDDEGATL